MYWYIALQRHILNCHMTRRTRSNPEACDQSGACNAGREGGADNAITDYADQKPPYTSSDGS